MRKIERQMNTAISNKVDWNSSNTRVEYNSNTDCSTGELTNQYSTYLYFTVKNRTNKLVHYKRI